MRETTSDVAHGVSAGKSAALARRSWKGSAATMAFLLVLVAGGCLASKAFASSQGKADSDTGAAGLVAHVTDADGTSYDLPLSSSGEITVHSSAGTNVVRVEDGAVLVAEADCPNQDCVRQGGVSSAGQQIVCLPNKLVVSVGWSADADGCADGETDGTAGECTHGSSSEASAAFDVIGS